MAPKKKKGGKSFEQSTEYRAVSTPELTEKEAILQAELDAVSLELETAKDRVKNLRNDNEWLQQEAQQIRIETHEYMGYIEKKMSKRQTSIVTLSDHNKQEIKNIEDQKKMIAEEFDEKKNKLKSVMLEKQHLLAKAKKELDGMQDLKSLQCTQTERIVELEALITDKRAKNAKKVQQLKSEFLQEKRKCHDDCEEKINSLKNEANKEARKCLTEHTNHIKLENRELRSKLLGLIKKTKVLHEHHEKLEEQRKQLLREQQYTDDIRELRNVKLQKLLGSDATR